MVVSSAFWFRRLTSSSILAASCILSSSWASVVPHFVTSSAHFVRNASSSTCWALICACKLCVSSFSRCSAYLSPKNLLGDTNAKCAPITMEILQTLSRSKLLSNVWRTPVLITVQNAEVPYCSKYWPGVRAAVWRKKAQLFRDRIPSARSAHCSPVRFSRLVDKRFITRLEKCRPGRTHELLELRGKSCIWSSLRSLDMKFGSRTKSVNKPPPRWRKPFNCINFRENQSETIAPPSQEFRKCRTVYRVGGDSLWGFGLLFSRKRRRRTINLEEKTVASSPWEFNNGGKDLCVQYIPYKVQPISILPSKLFFSALSGKPLPSFVSHNW